MLKRIKSKKVKAKIKIIHQYCLDIIAAYKVETKWCTFK